VCLVYPLLIIVILVVFILKAAERKLVQCAHGRAWLLGGMCTADHDATMKESEAAAAAAERASTRPGPCNSKSPGTADCPIDLDPPAGNMTMTSSGKHVRLTPHQGARTMRAVQMYEAQLHPVHLQPAQHARDQKHIDVVPATIHGVCSMEIATFGLRFMPDMVLQNTTTTHREHWSTQDALQKSKCNTDCMDAKTLEVACFVSGVYPDGATVSSFLFGDIVTIGVAIDCRMLRDPAKGSLVQHIGTHGEIMKRFVAHPGFPAWLDEVFLKYEQMVLSAKYAMRHGAARVRCVVSFYCKSGKHRSVAGSMIWYHILQSTPHLLQAQTIRHHCEHRWQGCGRGCPACYADDDPTRTVTVVYILYR
jgi:hypothetical protein